ncbi:MAG: serine/threonine-protein kinase [Planctomycetota bacterium]
MAESAQKVLHELTQGGLLSSDHVTKYGEELDTGADALLTRLVEDGRITQYQANKFKEGRSADIYFGDYVILDKLGQGGMGTVLLARHRVMDRQVAIKVLPVTVMDSKSAVARFYQEVKVAAQLTHPNIVHAYDAREHHGYHYLVMEYVAGHDLAEVVGQLGSIPSTLALDYIAQTASGLDYAHRKGIIHRDIKPSNLLLDNEGNIKILDMGLARIGNSRDTENSMQLTTTGQVMGTVEYMSPEQAEDTRQADARSDIYSLGCTLYRLLTGKSPFAKDTVVKTILAHREDPIPKIHTGMPDDDAINELLNKTLAKKPTDRYQSVAAVLDDIEKIQNGDYEATSSISKSPVIKVPPLVSRVLPKHEETMDRLGSISPGEPISGHAVGVRFRNENSTESIPEAIIPIAENKLGDGKIARDPFVSGTGRGSLPEVIPDDSVISLPGKRNQPSEIFYIEDKNAGMRPLSRIRNWMIANRSHSLFVWSFICCLPIPVIGLVLSWRNWRATKRDLKNIEQGLRTKQGQRFTKIARYVSVLATIVNVGAIVGLITLIAQ